MKDESWVKDELEYLRVLKSITTTRGFDIEVGTSKNRIMNKTYKFVDL